MAGPARGRVEAARRSEIVNRFLRGFWLRRALDRGGHMLDSDGIAPSRLPSVRRILRRPDLCRLRCRRLLLGERVRLLAKAC